MSVGFAVPGVGDQPHKDVRDSGSTENALKPEHSPACEREWYVQDEHPDDGHDGG